MLNHLKFAIPAGLVVGLLAAVVDAAALGPRHPEWMAFAFLAYGIGFACCLVAVALVTGALCAAIGLRPGPRVLAAFYAGLPLLALASISGGELIRRVVIPSVLKSKSEVAPIVGASLWGFVLGAFLVGVLVYAARMDARGRLRFESGGVPRRDTAKGAPPGRHIGALRATGLGVVCLAALSALALFVGEISYGRWGDPGGNLIIICVDALRPDHLSCYGYERRTSPNIDALCGSGARFDRAICQSPGSTASHASMLTSMYPLTHGAWNVGDSLHEDVPSLQKHMREMGYATAFFGHNFFLHPRFGFSAGFDTFGNEELAYKVKGAPLGLYPRSLGAARLVRAWRVDPGAPSEFSIDQALSWIEKNRKRKFFLFLHLMDPHAPYSPPVEYRRMFLSRDYPGEVRDGGKLRKRIASLEPWEKKQLVDLYDGEVAYADSKVGRLVKALRDWGIFDKTVIVITADHAEVLEEHGGVFNHGYLWDCCIRVPLIVHYPPAIPEGVVRSRVVQSIDIAPTALSLLSEPPLDHGQGADLTALVRDGDGAEAAGGVAYTLGGITKGEGYAITGRRWKLTWIDDDHVELYDLIDDPGETENLIDQMPEPAAELKRQLLHWIEESGAAATVPRSETVDLQRLESEVRERLRTLGYIK